MITYVLENLMFISRFCIINEGQPPITVKINKENIHSFSFSLFFSTYRRKNNFWRKKKHYKTPVLKYNFPPTRYKIGALTCIICLQNNLFYSIILRSVNLLLHCVFRSICQQKLGVTYIHLILSRTEEQFLLHTEDKNVEGEI